MSRKNPHSSETSGHPAIETEAEAMMYQGWVEQKQKQKTLAFVSYRKNTSLVALLHSTL